MLHRFRDRKQAGALLAERLAHYAHRPDLLVLALPRGGVVVGYELARALHAPLDVVIVRKLGVPGQEELAMGAIASGGVQVLNGPLVQALGISPSQIEFVASQERIELERRELLYRAGRAAPDLRGRTVILVDDGLATGATMRVAVAALQTQQVSRVIVAVPVAPRATCEELRTAVDEVICLLEPEDFSALSLWYDEFHQTTDEEVRGLLERANHVSPAA
ncbi:MAG: phosphoribosyltransferase [Acidobacteria bacterium]|nr:phosphoribosyltransferase [Acidobacteriota bacterium]